MFTQESLMQVLALERALGKIRDERFRSEPPARQGSREPLLKLGEDGIGVVPDPGTGEYLPTY
jgi:hypothetical protein